MMQRLARLRRATALATVVAMLLSLAGPLLTLPLQGGPAEAASVVLSEPFNTNTTTTAQTLATYPAWSRSSGGTGSPVTVQASRVVMSKVIDETLFDVAGVAGDLIITADLGQNGVAPGSYNVGLSIGANRLVFHPAFPGGAFRVEGPGGFSNRNMGFTPGANVMHRMQVSIAAPTRTFTIKVTDGSNAANVFTATFVGSTYSPGVSRLGFRMQGGSNVPTALGFYDNFAIQSMPSADSSPPVISSSTTGTLGSNAWYTSDVSTSWSVADPDSGLASTTGCGSSSLTSDTAGTTLTCTAANGAGLSASNTITIKRDATKPTLTGAPTTGPNTAGWYRGSVTIHWTCTDATSGPASCPADSAISGEGMNLTASATASDGAGNSTTATSSPPVRIDAHAPLTSASAPANWNNSDVTVALSAMDNLSGVQATYFILDGGAQQIGTSVPISSEGIHTLQFWSVDTAGNVEAAKNVQVKIDKTPPTINHSQSPAANGAGWNNTGVTVTFVCSDAHSGVASCTAPQTVTTEGQNQPVTGTATDGAGNSATDPATVSIDKTAPTITASRAPATGNANGWNNAPVVVTFTCTDALSGIGLGGCPAAVTVSNGANQSVSGTTTDAAGNSASVSIGGINVDTIAPVVAVPANITAEATSAAGAAVTFNPTATDNLSGAIATVCASPSGTTFPLGTTTVVCTSKDNADNAAQPTTFNVRVVDTTPPTASIAGSSTLNEGDTGTWTVTASDLVSSLLAISWDLDADGDYGDGTGASASRTFADNGTFTVRARIADQAGNATLVGQPVVVSNVSPTVNGVTAPVVPVPLGSVVNASASFTDPGIADTHTALFGWDDASTSPASIAETSGSGTASGSHTYATPGVYTVATTVTDKDGSSGSGSFQYVVVYDPNGGFVTGGGWIASPSGACQLTTACQGATGKATFGFNSKYHKGATTPTGNTEFEFRAGSLNFHATDYEWLVVAGARAQYKGSGTINGSGDYGFILTAIDGQVSGGGGADKFRIKIWSKATGGGVYDNQTGAVDAADPTTALGGGSIVIHP